MSVCPYYQRGNCRYGDQCRMPHGNPHQASVYHENNPPFRPRPRPPRPSIDPHYNYVAPSIANRNHHVQNINPSEKASLKYGYIFDWVRQNFADADKALDILVLLQKEARDWHQSDHFWRFTSRSLFPGGKPLEGWQDQSFEEVQWLYRSMKKEGREHVYKKDYYAYFENTARHLFGLLKLRIDILESLKDYINQYVISDYKPSKTFPSDVEMTDVNGKITENILSATKSTHYTPDDQLLEGEREAFKSGIFEFGQIPLHPPSKELC